MIAVVGTTLDWFSMDKAIDTGNAIPVVYMAGILVYSILLTAFAVFLDCYSSKIEIWRETNSAFRTGVRLRS